MGLAQKRIVKEYQDTPFAQWKKEFDKIVGFNMPIEVKWETLMNDDYDKKDQYFAWFDMVYFRPLKMVFQELCEDKMGKEAVKESVKQIIIDGSTGHTPEHSKFEAGTFFLIHKFHSNVDQEDERVKTWAKMIGDKL